MNWLLGLYFTYIFQSDRYKFYDANFYEPYSSHGSPSLQPSGRASSKGTQGLFSVKNLFGEENIVLSFLLLEDGRI